MVNVRAGMRCLIAFLCVATSSVTSAQEGARPAHIELTAFAGFRFGGEFERVVQASDPKLDGSVSAGLILNVQAEYNTQYEFLYSRQDTELETGGLFQDQLLLDIVAEYLQLGGTYVFDGDNARPFISVTVGGSRFNPKQPGFDSETYLAGTLGAGVKLRATQRVSVRVEGRGYFSLTDSDTEAFCQTGPDGNLCAFHTSGSLLSQWEALVGITVTF